jgi:lipopolysaccharide biosynthesis glycosyltransferase
MNLIYICVFHQESYIKLLKLLITSISVKANINKETTDLLIITSPSFQPLIQKELECFDLPLHYYTLDLHTLFEAGCARLNIFKYDRIDRYNKILYLDTDILLNSDVNVLFNLELVPEKLYALEEGTIGEVHWGAQLFDFSKYTKDQTAFTSGILFFKNSECMKLLFDSIQLHIADYIYTKKNAIPECLDQPFIVYNAISQDKYDNQVLKPFIENNPSIVHYKKIVYHFPGSPGKYDSKYSKMTAFWEKMNMNTVNIYEDIWTCSDEMRFDIADFFKDRSQFKIAEIGSHKGYTTKILSYMFSKVYAVDNSIEWTKFNKHYNRDRTNIEYIMLDLYKDSWNILPEDIDVVFIDAGHSYTCCKSDILNSLNRFHKLKYIIFDDYGVWEGVKKIIDELIDRHILIFERFIGLADVPGPHGLVKDTHEGIICRVNFTNIDLRNKKYTWQKDFITFLENGNMNAFGKGTYIQESTYIFQANFGGRKHTLVFNNEYTEFTSTRHGDNEIVKGTLL